MRPREPPRPAAHRHFPSGPRPSPVSQEGRHDYLGSVKGTGLLGWLAGAGGSLGDHRVSEGLVVADERGDGAPACCKGVWPHVAQGTPTGRRAAGDLVPSQGRRRSGGRHRRRGPQHLVWGGRHRGHAANRPAAILLRGGEDAVEHGLAALEEADGGDGLCHGRGGLGDGWTRRATGTPTRARPGRTRPRARELRRR